MEPPGHHQEPQPFPALAAHERSMVGNENGGITRSGEETGTKKKQGSARQPEGHHQAGEHGKKNQ
jgi:hypothetical protein